MKKIEIEIESRRDLHDLFERVFPQPYGRTLDALHDILSTYPEELVLSFDSDAIYSALGDRYGDNFMRMLKNTATENPKLQIIGLPE